MSGENLRKWIGRTSSTAGSDAESAQRLLERYREGIGSAPPADFLELRMCAAHRCQSAARELNREMAADQELSLHIRLAAAGTLIQQSWVMSYRSLGPSEFEGLIEAVMSEKDHEAWHQLAFLFQWVSENDALWTLWKPVVRTRLPELAARLLVPLLRIPKKRRECRLVAITVRHAAQSRMAQAAILAGYERMRGQGHERESAPSEVKTFLQSVSDNRADSAK